MNQIKDNCGNCFFFVSDGCRRYPPLIVVRASDQEGVTRFPRVMRTWWCGEHMYPKKEVHADA